MSLNISCYKIVGRKHLEELYDCSFKCSKNAVAFAGVALEEKRS